MMSSGVFTPTLPGAVSKERQPLAPRQCSASAEATARAVTVIN
jgi:hypothetical protein